MKIAILFISCLIAANAGLLEANTCAGSTCSGLVSGASCQCNSQCTNYGDCCSDYIEQCTCQTRCQGAYDKTKACQCNSQCPTYDNCCDDKDTCTPSSGSCSFTSSSTFSTFADCLWDSDVNRVTRSRYSYNKGTYISNTNAKEDLTTSDYLYTSFESSILTEGTYAKLVALFNNYNPQLGQSESFTTTENNEIDSFMDAVMATDVMTTAYNYLQAKGEVSSTSDLRAKIETAWFTSYSRSATDDSSAFEHTFLGEWKSSSEVSGYHNWVKYYYDENNAATDYFGYTGDLGSNEPEMLGLQFSWGSSSRIKKLTSIAFGVSPEFELAIFTAAFLESPGSSVNFQMKGKSITLQTWNWQGNNNIIGSAYFAV